MRDVHCASGGMRCACPAVRLQGQLAPEPAHFRILDQEPRKPAADSIFNNRNRTAENQAISIRAGLQDCEVEADDVILGQRIALGGYAEVFIGKYEVSPCARMHRML